MRILVFLLILIGVIVMVSNIVRYFKFMRSSTDVLTGRNIRTQFWVQLAFLLLVFFLIGYIGIWAFSAPDLLMASILCGGSIFVAIVITMIEKLMATAKKAHSLIRTL